MTRADGRSVGLAATALLASSATLVCCALPATLVSLGAGAALVGLIANFPQLVWLSEHKAGVFGIAASLLLIAGTYVWHARRLPCPINPYAARQCVRLRRVSGWLYTVAAFAFLVGLAFAFVLPHL